MKNNKVVKRFESNGEVVIFRYMEPKDENDLRSYFNSLVDERSFTTHEYWTKKRMQEWMKLHLDKIKKKTEVRLVVEIKGQVVGHAKIDIEEKPALRFIGDLGIGLRKEARRRGIGEKLLRVVITEAKRVMRIKVVVLDAFAKNIPAVNLYKKFGFKTAHILKKVRIFHGKFYDQIHMVKYV
ncbi:MAG: GNAT family N-acetyltransferase [Patescibacteria group bacterium]